MRDVVVYLAMSLDGYIADKNGGVDWLVGADSENMGSWICGGACIINQLIALNAVGRYHITVIPTVLGDGIRLFDKHAAQSKLRLASVKAYGEMVDLVYTPKKL